MENKKLKLDFEMQIKSVKDIENSQFAKAKVVVAYCGRNRNYSDIPKEVFETTPIACIPVVARYDMDKDDFGGHDVRVVNTDEGTDIYNATIPFGFVPESAEQWFEEQLVNGEMKTCFCTDVILWKRQCGYKHIAEAKTINQSMEIDVSDYTIDDDGYCIINKMKFEALTLLGEDVEPCFENARLELYNKSDDFDTQYQKMLEQYKEYSLKLRNEVNEMVDENENVVEQVEEQTTTTEEIIPTVDENIDAVVEEPVTDYESLYNNITAEYNSVLAELEELREYKATVEKEKRTNAETNIFDKFDEKLGAIEDYTKLKGNCAEYSIEDIEEKCYAIAGRYGISMIEQETESNDIVTKFSVVSKEIKADKPYGDVFEEYAD